MDSKPINEQDKDQKPDLIDIIVGENQIDDVEGGMEEPEPSTEANATASSSTTEALNMMPNPNEIIVSDPRSLHDFEQREGSVFHDSNEQAIQEALVMVKSDHGYIPAAEGVSNAQPATTVEHDAFRELETIMLPLTNNSQPPPPPAQVVHQDQCVGQAAVMINPEYIGQQTGFKYTLAAATSGMIRRGEDPLTYLNKDQFYALTLEYSGNHFRSEMALSVVSVQFREKEKQSSVKEAILHWELWMTRQQSPRQRVIETDHPSNSGIAEKVDNLAHNALKVKWNPHTQQAIVQIAVRSLSTDFSNQKGVKGIPLHIQIDTYGGEDIGLLHVVDKAFCQIKTFCDKGAERKAREEEKRLHRQPPPYACQPIRPKSVFVRSVNGEFNREAVLFQPKLDDGQPPPPIMVKSAFTSSPLRSSPASSSGRRTPAAAADRKQSPSTKGKSPPQLMVYVRQENEEVFTPLAISPPTARGFIYAVAAKYQIDCNDVRKVYKKFLRGIVVWVDDDLIKLFNSCSFLMKVLAVESGDSTRRVLYDIVLIEDNNNSPCLPPPSGSG